MQRWKDGGEYKMLLKEIAIRAIRWCRLAVCVKTHPALAPGLCWTRVKSKSNWTAGRKPASTHCPQQLRGIWSTNHTAPEVLFQSEMVSVCVWEHIRFMGQFAQCSMSLLIFFLELRGCFIWVFTVETSGLLLLSWSFFGRLRVSDLKNTGQMWSQSSPCSDTSFNHTSNLWLSMCLKHS